MAATAPVQFPPRDESLDFLVNLNSKYGIRPESAGQVVIYAETYPLTPSYLAPLVIDGEGLAVWMQEYLLQRVLGFSHADAVLVVFAQIDDIWDPAHAPHPRPELPDAGGPDQPGVADNAARFGAHYLAMVQRGAIRPPDHTTTRDQRITIHQTAILDYRAATGDKSFVMKRNGTNPISDDVIVFMADPKTGDYRRFFDVIGNAGAANWSVKTTTAEVGHGEILPAEQILVDPVSLQNMVG